MTRARMPRPHEVAVARRDPRLLASIENGAPMKHGALAARARASIRRRSFRPQRAGRARGRALPHVRRAGRLPGLGAARWATATASGAPRHRGSGGRCSSPGANGSSRTVTRVGTTLPGAGRSAAVEPGAAEAAAPFRSCPSFRIVTPHGPAEVGSRRPAARRCSMLVLGHGAGGGVSTRRTSWRYGTRRVAAAWRGAGHAAVPGRGPPFARAGGAAGRGLDRGGARDRAGGTRPAARRRPVERRPGGLPDRGRAGCGRCAGARRSRCTRRAGRTVSRADELPPSFPRWWSTATGTRSAFRRPAAPSRWWCVRARRTSCARTWPGRPARSRAWLVRHGWAVAALDRLAIVDVARLARQPPTDRGS